MKKLLLSGLLGIFLLHTSLFAEQAKGLNVVLTSADAQTQQMAMVLSLMTLKQGKKVNMVICSKAGDLSVKGMKSQVLKPMNKSPKQMLKNIISKGANVKICPLYLPNAEKKVEVLIEGVVEANPKEIANMLLDMDYKVLSY